MTRIHTYGAVLALSLLLPACTSNRGTDAASSSPSVAPEEGTLKPVPIVALAISPQSVTEGGTATATWTSANALSCTGSGALNGDIPVQNTAGLALGPLTQGTYTYTVTCSGIGGSATASQTLQVGTVPAPAVSFTMSPVQIQPGNSTSIVWSTTNATSCEGSGGTGSDGWATAQPTSNPSGYTTPPISGAGQYTYSLTCTGSGGTTQQTAILTVASGAPPAPPVVSFTANPTVIVQGHATQFSWNSGNASRCSASGGSGADAWSGDQPLNSSGLAIGPLNTTGDFAYALTCTGVGGTTVQTLDIEVEGATIGSPVAITFAVNPTTVTTGAAAALTWATTNATGCAASGSWSGSKPLSAAAVSTGTLSVPGTYTYTLDCVGAGGSQAATASATVTVNEAPASIGGFSATPATIGAGGSTSLTWTSSNATSCTGGGGSGSDGWGGVVGTSRSSTVTLNAPGTYTYTLTCTGPGGTSPPSTAVVTVNSAATISGFTAAPNTLVAGGTTQLSWSSDNATSCVRSGGTGSDGWPGTTTTTSSGTPVTIAHAGIYTYTLTCTGGGGASAPVSVTVDVNDTQPAAAILAFTATPESVAVNQATQLAWATTDASGCTASDGVGSWGGTVSASSTGTSITLADPGTYTFALTCSGPGGTSAPATATVTATTAAPQASITSFTAVPSSIQTHQATTLTWSSTGASACTASGGSGTDGWSGSVGTSNAGRSVTVASAGSFTYLLTCTGPGGDSNPSAATVTVTDATPPASIDSLVAAPNSLLVGQSTRLSWSSSNATSCTAGGGTGSDGWSGQLGTSSTGTMAGPLNTPGNYSYMLTCTGTGGSSAPRSVSVTVDAPPAAPTVSLTATPTTLASGQSATLSWTTSGATACTASGGTGADGWTTGTVMTSNSAAVVTPAASTGYTLVCSGPGGQSSPASVAVSVNAPVPGLPTITFQVNGATAAQIQPNQSPTLTWSTTNAVSCSASGGTGSDGWNGSEPIPGGTATLGAISTPGVYAYTLTCTGAGGTSSQTVTLKVIASSAADCGIGEASTLLETPGATASWSQLTGVCVLGCGVLNLGNVIDSNTQNFATVYTTVGLGATIELKVNDAGATYPAGRSAGFLMAYSGRLLSLSLLGNLSVVTFLGNTVQEVATSSNLLQLQALGTLYDPDAAYVGFRTTKPFTAVALEVNSLAAVGRTFRVYGACATLQ